MDQNEWSLLKRFHGHVGPWLIVGLRIGEQAMTLLKARRAFGVSVDARCPLHPPQSCMLDGLQWATGATYGKQNLLATECDEISVTVRNTDECGACVFRLVPSVGSMFAQWLAEVGDEEASRRALDADMETLTSWEVLPDGSGDGSR